MGVIVVRMSATRRLLERPRAAAALAGVVTVTAIACWWLWPVRYEFEFTGRLHDPDDAAALVELADAVARVDAYAEPPGGDRTVDELSAVFASPRWRGDDWGGLVRSGAAGTGGMNAWAAAVTRELPGEPLDAYRDHDPAGRRVTLEELGARLADCRRRFLLTEHLTRPEAVGLLRRLGQPAFPAGPARGLVTARQRRWVDAFLKRVDGDVRPVHALYAAVLSEADRPVRGDGAGGVGAARLRPLPGHGAGDGPVLAELDSTCDFALLYTEAPPAADGDRDRDGHAGGGEAPPRAGRICDTGVRAVRVRWEERGGSWRPDWPPAAGSVAIDLDRLRAFLTDCGLPAGLRVLSGELRAGGAEVAAVVTSPQFPDWRHEVAVDLSQPTLADQRIAFAAATTKLLASLADHAAGLDLYAGRPAAIERTDGNPPRLALTVNDARLGPVELAGGVGKDGVVRWAALPERIADRRRILIASRVGGGDPAIRLVAVRFDPGEGTVAVETAGPDARPAVTTLPPSDPTEPAPPPPPAAEPAPDAAALAAAVRTLLNSEYPDVAPFVELVAETGGGGPRVRAGVTVGDWPVLEVGPFPATDTGGAVRQLLSGETLTAASREQWVEVEHPRYGRVGGEVGDWDPATGVAEVRTTIAFHMVGDVSWPERLRTAGGGWEVPTVEQVLTEHEHEIADAVDGAAGFLLGDLLVWIGLPELAEAAVAWTLAASGAATGAEAVAEAAEWVAFLNPKLEVELDRRGIDGERWWGTHPPRVAVKIGAKLLTVPLAVEGISISADGVSMPAECGVGLPGTFSTPYGALAEPGLMFDVRNPGLTINGRLTPPNPEMPLGWWPRDPWEPYFGLDGAAKGYFPLTRFEGDADFRLGRRVARQLNVRSIASADLTVDLDAGEIRGGLRGGKRLPGFETLPLRAAGNLRAGRHPDGTAYMNFEMDAEVWNEATGRFALTFGGDPDGGGVEYAEGLTDPYGCGVSGDLALRVWGVRAVTVAADGGARGDFERYRIRGRGSAGPVSLTMLADEEHFEVDIEWRTESGVTVRSTVHAPDLASLEALTRKVIEQIEKDVKHDPPPPPSPAEAAVIATAFRPAPPPRAAPDAPGSPAGRIVERLAGVDEAERVADPPVRLPPSDFEVFDLPGGGVGIRMKNGGRVLARFPPGAVPDGQWREVPAVVWAGSGECRVLTANDIVIAAALHTFGVGGEPAGAPEDLTGLLAPLDTRAVGVGPRFAALDAWMWWHLNFPDFAGSLRAADDAAVLELTPEGEDRPRFASVFPPERPFDIAAGPTGAGEVTDAFLARARADRPDAPFPSLLAASGDRLGWLAWPPADGEPATFHLTGGDRAAAAVPTVFAVEEEVLPQRPGGWLFAALADAGPLKDCKAVLTDHGAFAADRTRLFVGVDGEGGPMACDIPREAFALWRDESRRFLPGDWASRDVRRDVTAADLARVAAAARDPDATRERFPADPVGLLFKLANSVPQTAATPEPAAVR